MKILFALILLSAVFISCSMGVEQNFVVVNNSGNDLDSLNIFPDTANFQKLNMNDSIEYKCNMKGLPEVDGIYALNFIEIQSKRLKRYGFGYFANGMPIESEIRIVIFPDSISATSVF